MTAAYFPAALLVAPWVERLRYFKSYAVSHPLLKKTDTALWSAIQEPASASLIFVYGPTGVGKTTLRQHVEERLLKMRDPATPHLPVIGLEAIAPDAGKFSWKGFYKRGLIAVEQPFVEDKLGVYDHGFFHDRGGHLSISPRASIDDLRLGFEYSLRYRQPKALFIDDAQHLAKAPSARKLQDQLDSIKSLASQSHTLQVLVGTYELLALRNLSGQLSRRSIDIHFPRYCTAVDDLKAFQNVLWALQRHLPLSREPELMRHWEFCYVRSIGCVGILKDWLTRALAATLMDDGKMLTFKTLKAHASLLSQCEKMAAEAVEGEQMLFLQNQSETRLLNILGFQRKVQDSAAKGVILEPEIKTTAETRSGEAPRLPKKFRRVGQRNPTRDPVG
ncbi:MAG: AAA family ATPase [Pyrinomonadaceae bacterium]